MVKRRKGGEQLPQQKDEDDEQALSESALNKLVGAAEIYDLEVKDFFPSVSIVLSFGLQLLSFSTCR